MSNDEILADRQKRIWYFAVHTGRKDQLSTAAGTQTQRRPTQNPKTNPPLPAVPVIVNAGPAGNRSLRRRRGSSSRRSSKSSTKSRGEPRRRLRWCRPHRRRRVGGSRGGGRGSVARRPEGGWWWWRRRRHEKRGGQRSKSQSRSRSRSRRIITTQSRRQLGQRVCILLCRDRSFWRRRWRRRLGVRAVENLPRTLVP